MRRRRPSAIVSTLAFVIPTALIVAGIWWFFAQLQPFDPANKNVTLLTIAPNTGVMKIADQLFNAKLIKNKYTFEAAVVLAGLGKDLKAGTFALSPDQSATAIARVLAKGQGSNSKCPTAKEIPLTIPEESTSKEIGVYLEKQGIGTKDAFVAAVSVHDSRTLIPNEQFDFLIDRPAAATLEGFLYPDTYCVFSNATAADVIKKMLENFGTKATSALRQQAEAHDHSLYEVVTLASIVEKEAKTDQDRALVADIFWRRIKAGIALQSDVTVRYAAGLVGAPFDTKLDSPYNTYVVKGLPPGPIDNPRLSSIQAALNPTPNDNLYFLTDAAGNVHYAQTFEEHLVNKQKYLQ